MGRVLEGHGQGCGELRAQNLSFLCLWMEVLPRLYPPWDSDCELVRATEEGLQSLTLSDLV